MNHSSQHHTHKQDHHLHHTTELSGHDHREVATIAKHELIVSGVVWLYLMLAMMLHLPLWIELLLGWYVVLKSGRAFHAQTFRALTTKRFTMDVLITLSTVTAMIWSTATLLMGGIHFIESAVAIIFFVLLGVYLEDRQKRKTRDAVQLLFAQHPTIAHRQQIDLTWRDVATGVLQVGDRCLVKPGELIPQDGVVLVGETTIDESMFTGEPIPASKTKGDTVYGGTINKSQAIEIEITSEQGEGVFDQMIALVDKALTAKAPIESLVDKVTTVFVPVVIIFATITLILWMYVNPDTTIAVRNAIAVLVIACPCALGIATPAAVMAGTALGAKRGVLIKDGKAFEAASHIDIILFDKTGTLTVGRPTVTAIYAVHGMTQNEIVRVAANLEQQSEHPIAQAIIEYAKQTSLNPESRAWQVEFTFGKGVVSKDQRSTYRIGSESWLIQEGCVLTDDTAQWIQGQRDLTATVICLAQDQSIIGAIAISDPLRADAIETIRKLREQSIDVGMVTGDHQKSAEAIAKQLDIDQIMAEVLPTKKAEIVKKLVDKGYKVAFVGDGVNDAPALATATLGIAMGSGTDIAKSAGQMVIMGGSPAKALEAMKLSRLTFTTIKQNLVWAFIYNIGGLFLASFGYVHPAVAGLAMAFSSVSVLINSLRVAKSK